MKKPSGSYLTRNSTKKLDSDPTLRPNKVVSAAVQAMEQHGTINLKTAADLIKTKLRTLHFYMLPKIHKWKDNPFADR